MEPKPSSESGGFGKGVVYVVLEVVKTSRRGCGMLFAHHPGPMCVLIQFRVCVWTVSLFQDVRAGSVCVCCERERDGAGVCVSHGCSSGPVCLFGNHHFPWSDCSCPGVCYLVSGACLDVSRFLPRESFSTTTSSNVKKEAPELADSVGAHRPLRPCQTR